MSKEELDNCWPWREEVECLLNTSLYDLKDHVIILICLFQLSGTNPNVSVSGDILPCFIQHLP